MISREQLLLLQDMSDDKFTDVIIFDKKVDMAEVRKVVKQLWDREEWTFDDLLAELDKFGGYCLIPLSAIEKVEY